MNSRRYLLLSFLSIILLWACQKEKQPITKLPDSKVVAVGDSVQPMHLTMADSVCGKYLVSGLFEEDDDFQYGLSVYLDTILNDTMLISKSSDSSITCTGNSNIRAADLVGIPCPKTTSPTAAYSFLGRQPGFGLNAKFYSNNLDSVYIYYYVQAGCDRSIYITLSGTKIH